MKRSKWMRLLSLDKEIQFGEEELYEYFNELREYVLRKKLINITLGALTISPKLKKITNRIAQKVTKILCRKKVEIFCDGQENIPNSPVIFAATHQEILDGFVWISFLLRHC